MSNQCHILGAVQKEYLSFTTDYPPVYDISGFDVISRLEVFHVFDKSEKSHSFSWRNRTVKVAWLRDPGRIEIVSNKKLLISIEIWELVERARAYLKNTPGSSKFSVPSEVLTLRKENARVKAKLIFDDVSVEVMKDQRIFAHFKSDVYLKFKFF